MTRPKLKIREGSVQISGAGVEGEYRIRPMPGPVVYLLMRGEKVVYVAGCALIAVLFALAFCADAA